MKYTMTVDAIQWTGENDVEIYKFFDTHKLTDFELRTYTPVTAVGIDEPRVLINSPSILSEISIRRCDGSIRDAKLGDYIVINPRGDGDIMAENEFNKLFKEYKK